MDVGEKVIGLALAGIMIAAVLSTAITQIEAVNTTTWGTATAALWAVVGVFVIIAVVRWLVRK